MTLSHPITVSTGSSHRSVIGSSSLEMGLVLTQDSLLGRNVHPVAVSRQNSEDGSLSPTSRSHATAPVGATQAFDSQLREAVWLLAEEFSNTSTLLLGFYEAKLNKERIIALTIEALMQRCKSPASTRGVIRNVKGLIRFYLENRDESNPSGITLTGDSSVVLLRDYIESVADRGRTVPGAVKTSLSTWSEALGISWPLDNPLVCAAAHVESSDIPKHAPPMKLETVKKLEAIALDVTVTPFKRAFAAGALLMTFTSLRFSDAQRLRSPEKNDDSIFGTLPQSKTKRPHGLPWPWACPLTGASGSKDWVLPIFDFHQAHLKTNGSHPSFVFPVSTTSGNWKKRDPLRMRIHDES